MEKKRGKIVKGDVENLKCKEKSMKMSRIPFFPTVGNHLNLFGVNQKSEIYTGEKAFHARKKSGK